MEYSEQLTTGEIPTTSASSVPPAEEPSMTREGSPNQPSEPEGNGSEDSTDPTWQMSTPKFSTSVRLRMQEENLYAKFPPETALLKKFKNHLVSVLQIPNCQQEVDNVSRMIRFLQPTGNEVSLDFLDNTSVLASYFTQLKKVGQSAATRINYIKSFINFIKFLRLDLGSSDPELVRKCNHYFDFLSVLRKPISKNHSKDLCSRRHAYFAGPKTTVYACQKVLREAKKEVLSIYGRLLSGETVTEEKKTTYRYYCEGIIILGHFQRPGAVEGLTVTEWIQKKGCNGRMVVAVKSHKTANRQVAPFALTEEEAAIIDQYFLSVRPGYVENEDADSEHLFLAKNGRPIKSATNDLRRLHERYKLKSVTSQEIRRAVETEGNSFLTEEQKTGMAHYLAHTDKVANDHYRMREPATIVNIANLMSIMTQGSSEESADDRAQSSKRAREAPDDEDFEGFTKKFPVTLDGKPPSKLQRTGAGFSTTRVLYDKWRALQFKLREKHLLARWTRQPPTLAKLQKRIAKEEWLSNCPTAQSLMAKWSPPCQEEVESSQPLMRLVCSQKWKHLAVVDPSPKAGHGKGVVTTKRFPKHSIICDYHGELISGAEGRKRMAARDNEMGYAFFFKAGSRDLCMDATAAPCQCHPEMETFGRLINHSKTHPNVKPVQCTMHFEDGPRDVILFRGTRDLNVNEELLFDYGVSRKSFNGEGADLTWLE